MATFREYMDKAHEVFAEADTAIREADILDKEGRVVESKAKRLEAASMINAAKRVAKLALKLPDAPIKLNGGASKNAPKDNKSLLSSIYENVVGSGAVDTPGEKLGAGIKDISHAATAGFARGVSELVGLPGTLSNGADSLATGALNLGSRLFGGKGNLKAPPPSFLSGEKLSEGLGKITGGFTNYAGKSFPARAAGVAGEFAPGVLTMEGAGLKALAKYAALPGAASEAAGSVTHGTKAEPYARLAASILSPIAVGSISRIGAKMITPNIISDPQRIAYLKNLKLNNIDPTAGQATGNVGLQYKEAVTDFGKQSILKQNEQFTAAAMSHVGSKAKLATPEALANVNRAIGDKFKKIAKGSSVVISRDGLNKAKKALLDYKDSVSPVSQSKLPVKIYEKINNAASNSQKITGKDYLDFTSRLGKLSKSLDPAVREVSIRLREILDTEFQKTLALVGEPEKVALLKEARLQYKNFLAIERAAAGGGEAAAFGVITPAKLRTSVNAIVGKRSYTQATDGLPMLARSGTAILKTLPQSGTAPRLSALANVGAAGAPLSTSGLAYMATGSPGLSIGLGAASAAYPIARNALIGTKLGQRYLSNQVLSSYPIGVSLSGLASQIPAATAKFRNGNPR